MFSTKQILEIIMLLGRLLNVSWSYNVVVIARCPLTPDKVLFQNISDKFWDLKGFEKDCRKCCTHLNYSLFYERFFYQKSCMFQLHSM